MKEVLEQETLRLKTLIVKVSQDSGWIDDIKPSENSLRYLEEIELHHKFEWDVDFVESVVPIYESLKHF